MKRWLGRLALSALTVALCLLVIEGVLRAGVSGDVDFVAEAVVAEHPMALYRMDPGQRTRLQPQVSVVFRTAEYSVEVRTNSLGMRGPEPQPGGLLCLGDSFTLAAQVPEEQSWCGRLSGANGGVDGYGTVQAVEAMGELLGSVRPRQVVLGFYLGNDLRDNARAESPPEPIRPPHVSPMGEALSGLSRRLGGLSYTWSTLAAAWSLHQADFRIEEYADEMLPFVDLDARDRLSGPTRRALEQFQRRCGDLYCLVVLIPPVYVVDGERTEATFSAFGLPVPEDIDALARHVETLTTLPVLDLTPALREASDKALYYRFDPHWTAEGHRVAAAAIQAMLQP